MIWNVLRMLFWTTFKSLEYGLVDINIFRFPMFLRFWDFFFQVFYPCPRPSHPKKNKNVVHKRPEKIGRHPYLLSTHRVGANSNV